ncbi:MAG: hypothetical protein ACI4EF_12780 [Coprococcus sp.]
MAIDSARSMKKVLKFMFGLLINVCILFALVKIFSSSYEFAYEVFATTAKDAGDSRTVTVEVLPEETLWDICDSLEEAGVIKNKYAFMLKVRIGEYAPNIIPDTYELAPSYTNKKIIEVLTGQTQTAKK